MILETSNPDFMVTLKNSVPKYSHLKVKLVDKDGQKFNRTLAWSAGGENIMVLGYRRKHYGSYINWDYFKSVIIPEKRAKVQDKWVRSWTNVLTRLEQSGLWEEVAEDVRTALAVGHDKLEQAYTQYWVNYPDVDYQEHDRLNAEAIKKIDERLVGYREDGTPYADTNIIWYMHVVARVKKMHFGKKWLNSKELEDIANALKNKQPIRVGTDGRITGGYDVSYNYQPEDNKAWYSEEYRRCGNGHYYLGLDATHALFYEDD
jgi:hypothetical protein